MSRWLETIQGLLSQIFLAIGIFFQTLGWNPLNWNGAVWLSLVIIGLALGLIARALVKRSKASDSTKPELLVSKGIIQQPESSPTQVLSLKISNLNDYPVQLLEMALQSELMSTPFMVEAAEIIAPHAAVELEAVLPNNIVGDRGHLEIYVYLSKRREKIYRLSTTFAWEPWSTRYKVEATGQRLRQTRQLASSKINQARKKAWFEQNLKTQPQLVRHDTQELPEPAPKRLKPQLDTDFPTEF